MGRPIKEIKDHELRALLRMKPTAIDCAAFFQCSVDSIERYIKKNYSKTFAEFRDENMVHTRFGLIRKAIDMANSGNTAMMIFALKNLCGWTDKLEQVAHEGTKINIVYGKKDES